VNQNSSGTFSEDKGNVIRSFYTKEQGHDYFIHLTILG
jgi:hypothetical protein